MWICVPGQPRYLPNLSPSRSNTPCTIDEDVSIEDVILYKVLTSLFFVLQILETKEFSCTVQRDSKIKFYLCGTNLRMLLLFL